MSHNNKPHYNMMPSGVAKQATKENHALDASRYAIDRFIMDERSPSNGEFIDNLQYLKQAREHAKLSIKKHLDEIEFLDKIENEIEQSPYKVGDVAFHKELGNIIVEGYAVDADKKEMVLRVTNAKKRDVVRAVDLAPISSTTKLLYGK
mgnify:CR=1 FL=1